MIFYELELSQMVLVSLTSNLPLQPDQLANFRTSLTQTICNFLQLSDCSRIVFIGIGELQSLKRAKVQLNYYTSSFSIAGLYITGNGTTNSTTDGRKRSTNDLSAIDLANAVAADLASSNSQLLGSSFGHQYGIKNTAQVTPETVSSILGFQVFDGGSLDSFPVQSVSISSTTKVNKKQ